MVPPRDPQGHPRNPQGTPRGPPQNPKRAPRGLQSASRDTQWTPKRRKQLPTDPTWDLQRAPSDPLGPWDPRPETQDPRTKPQDLSVNHSITQSPNHPITESLVRGGSRRNPRSVNNCLFRRRLWRPACSARAGLALRAPRRPLIGVEMSRTMCHLFKYNC